MTSYETLAAAARELVAAVDVYFVTREALLSMEEENPEIERAQTANNNAAIALANACGKVGALVGR